MKNFLTKLKNRVLAFLSSCRCKMKIFKGKRFLLCTVIINVVFIFLWIAVYLRRHSVPWVAAIGFLFASVAACFAWYAQEFLSWCQDYKHQKIERAVSAVNGAFIFFLPVISFFIATSLSQLFFEKPLSIIDIVGCSLLAIMHLIYVVYYCIELKDITRSKYTPMFRAKFLVACIIHIAQIFADIYIILFIIFPNSFTGIDTSSAFSISFDFTYFSAMTLLTAGSEIIATSRLAKSVVLIETFLFVIVISMVIFVIFSSDAREQYDKQNTASEGKENP